MSRSQAYKLAQQLRKNYGLFTEVGERWGCHGIYSVWVDVGMGQTYQLHRADQVEEMLTYRDNINA